MSRLDRLYERRIDQSILAEASMSNEVYRRMKDSPSIRFTIGAMQPIDPVYTRNTYIQGDRVKSQLSERVAEDFDFEYQGSTTTDTHVKARSDIDLLMIHNKWIWLERPQVPASPYQGVPSADMRAIRSETEVALREAFPKADHDQDGARSIKLSGASLKREVDVVPASWHNTNEYARTGDPVHRGVKVFDLKSGEFVANTPFLHKRRLQLRDEKTSGGLRKAIRLMKTLRYDSEGRVSMSSYDICGIAYNIEASALTVNRPRELMILEACYEYCQQLALNDALWAGIVVPDGSRPVFGGTDGSTPDELDALLKEISDLRTEILRENVHSLKRLIEASVDYPGEVLVYS